MRKRAADDGQPASAAKRPGGRFLQSVGVALPGAQRAVRKRRKGLLGPLLQLAHPPKCKVAWKLRRHGCRRITPCPIASNLGVTRRTTTGQSHLKPAAAEVSPARRVALLACPAVHAYRQPRCHCWLAQQCELANRRSIVPYRETRVRFARIFSSDLEGHAPSWPHLATPIDDHRPKRDGRTAARPSNDPIWLRPLPALLDKPATIASRRTCQQAINKAVAVDPAASTPERPQRSQTAGLHGQPSTSGSLLMNSRISSRTRRYGARRSSSVAATAASVGGSSKPT